MSLKDLFIKSEETNNNETSAPVNATPAPVSAAPTSTPSSPVTAATTTSISADERITNAVWNKIIEMNRPGPDYLELKNNVDALGDLPISGEQKILSSFKILKANYPNFTKEDIITAIDYYKKVVDKEKTDGLAELEDMRKTNVDSVETEIKEMKEKADALKVQYDELQQRINDKSLELAQNKSEVEMNTQRFLGSIDAVLNILDNDSRQIQNINF